MQQVWELCHAGCILFKLDRGRSEKKSLPNKIKKAP